MERDKGCGLHLNSCGGHTTLDEPEHGVDRLQKHQGMTKQHHVSSLLVRHQYALCGGVVKILMNIVINKKGRKKLKRWASYMYVSRLTTSI